MYLCMHARQFGKIRKGDMGFGRVGCGGIKEGYNSFKGGGGGQRAARSLEISLVGEN